MGDYFATMTTPDVYTLFIKEMVNAGYTEEYARANLIMTDIPLASRKRRFGGRESGL